MYELSEESKIDNTPPSIGLRNSINIDIKREELPWEEREEKIIAKWKEDGANRKLMHNKKSKHFKKLYNIFGMLNIMIPFTGSLVSLLVDNYHNEHMTEVSTIILATTTVVSGINAFWNFGEKSEKHSDYENRYGEYISSIEKEMVKPRKYRIACDVCMEWAQNTLNRLHSSAPEL